MSTESNKALVRWHYEEVLTGKRVVARAIHIHQIVDGRIAALWEAFDMFGLMRQLEA
jgi:predicted ester cyclase